MTEKQYGGATGRETKHIAQTSKNSHSLNSRDKNKKLVIKNSDDKGLINKDNLTEHSSSRSIKLNNSNKSVIEAFQKANKIADEIREFAEKIVKKDIPLIEIAEKIENRIIELNGKLAFPVNTSINEIAAHYTPKYNDDTLAHGLLKVDFGIQINGWTSDNAIAFDLENSDENKKLIEAAEKALENAIALIDKKKEKTKLSEVGGQIEKAINSFGFRSITNLSGHAIEQYELHAGMTVPNFNNNDETEIGFGLRAIEPFSTNGVGKIHDGKPSGIYKLLTNKLPRSPSAREVLNFIEKEYNTLPFCSRWIYKKFSSRGLFALKELENNGNLHQFTQLVESGKGKIAQAERTVLV